jgi:hypothetical protein
VPHERTEVVLDVWKRVAGLAAAIVVIIGAFVLPVPDVVESSWAHFARFLIAFSVVVLEIVAYKTTAVPFTRRWLVFSIAMLIAGVLLYMTYSATTTAWVVQYDHHDFVVGSPYYSHDAVQTRESIKAQTGSYPLDYELIHQYNTADVADIWDSGLTDHRRGVIIAEYVLSIWFLAVAVVGVVQAYSSSRAHVQRRQSSSRRRGDVS